MTSFSRDKREYLANKDQKRDISETILASTLHNPENLLSKYINRTSLLKEIFKSIIIVVTPKTHPNIGSLLSRLGFEVYKGEDSIISVYLTALKHASTKSLNQRREHRREAVRGVLSKHLRRGGFAQSVRDVFQSIFLAAFLATSLKKKLNIFKNMEKPLLT